MQIVIEISEDTYKKLTQKSMLMSASAIDEAVDAVKKGIVLPKGHGDLIDRDTLKKDDETALWLSLNAVRAGKMLKYFSELFIKKIDSADAIIPADKEGDWMSIFSDHDVGALSDEEFEMEGIRMNNRDRIEIEEELERLYHDEDSEGGLISDD